jgi:flavorubredoxin
MFTFVPEEKLLFSMDAFGQHYASSQRFDYEAPLDIVIEEAKSYYANILLPFNKRVAAVIGQIKNLGVEKIAPAHGLMWSGHVSTILDAYESWANNRLRPKALILFDTMWDSTGKMARAILEGTDLPGVESRLIHIRHSNLTRIATEMLETATIAFGSSTLNQGMMPAAGAVLTYLKGLKPTGRAGFSFGSYGWSRGGPEAAEEYLKAMKWEILREPVTAQYRPTPAVLDECRAAGRKMAERAMEMAAQ